ncbi:filamentous hemagglutinin N-terminal domain-containing protein [Pantanalinema rosaneae CENA516]|uniref:two-partner secretion domain-containing protein n=1 Tax=Pantanalinema rosaneae TaxID=1620701 RepID=UPI003D6FAD4B
MKVMHYWFGCCSFLLATVGMTLPIHAQVVPDRTLNTTVTQSGNNFTITDGTTQGSNLFHSFSQFSVPTGGSAFFNNATTIQNIFARVTGGNISNIDGLIRANGSANLFLLNPSGILFGPNARLNLGGSFTATTATSVSFADGTTFSATDTTAPPLLTISVPVGLQLGANARPITVQGAGNAATFDASTRVSLNLGTQGLQVNAGKTLALIGGDLAVTGGLLSAPGGRIELGSVIGGSVALNANSPGLTLSYPNASSFGNIQLTQRALASVRGTRPGSIQVQGNQVNVQGGSLVLVQNQGTQTAGDIVVNAAKSLQIIGKSPNFLTSSALVNETTAVGAAGNILINTPSLLIDQGGFVLDRTFSAAPGGNIGINATDMTVNGFTAGDPNAFRAVSQVVVSSHSQGKGGNLAISTRDLVIAAGGNVAARPFGSGAGGNITVNADTIQVLNAGAPTGFYFSLLSAATFGVGNSGNLTVNTRTLSVQGGARVSASSIISGSAGNLIINASESIEVNGVKDAQNPSYIGTAVRPVGLVSNASAGNTTINTRTLTINNGASVFVENRGLGQAGTLTVNADFLKLDNGASLSASTAFGGGGNLNLQLQKGVIMRHGSFISATAGGKGNGGNITIASPVVAGLENSDIIANASQGRGGNINITTQGIIGLKYRDQLTPESDITASSQFGVSGTVQVNNIGVDPNSGLVELPTNVVDSSQQIATGCTGSQDSSFIATGRGGVPQNPMQQVQADRTWNDVRELSTYRQVGKPVAQEPAAVPTLIQANTWQRHADGTVELIADHVSVMNSTFATCSGVTVREIESAP